MMKVLITGGYGNIGIAVLEECLKRGHEVTVFDVQNGKTMRQARKHSRRSVKTLWGDIRNPECVSNALEDIDAVIHLAAILPPLSDANPRLCEQVNVGGVENLIDAILLRGKAALVEVSSASVMGPTQAKEPPVRPHDALVATDTYSKTKVEAERLVESRLSAYCVLRLAAVLPTNINVGYFINMIKVMFDMPLKARCEIVLDIDVAFALVSAAENLLGGGELRGKTGFIAGGPGKGCRLTNGGMLREVFGRIGLRFPRETLFASDLDNYYLDWYDTGEIQAILRYQNHSFDEWKDIIKRKLGRYAWLIRICGRPILGWLERQSKYGRGS
jgi:nucleoside-diphosphate-sugar epimerase